MKGEEEAAAGDKDGKPKDSTVEAQANADAAQAFKLQFGTVDDELVSEMVSGGCLVELSS